MQWYIEIVTAVPNGYNVIRRKIICHRLPQKPEKVVRQHIQDGHTLASLDAEYGMSNATVSNWVRVYREECQNNDAAMSELQLMEELRRLLKEKAELEKEIYS